MMNSQDPTARLPPGGSPCAEQPRAMLLLYHGHDVKSALLSPHDAVTIGRDVTANVVLPDASVSKRHARLTFDGKQFVKVEDLGSTNGTIFKGHNILKDQPLDVGHGAELYFGAILGIVHIPGARFVAPTVVDVGKQEAIEGELVASASSMRRVLKDVEQFAKSAEIVVITGETGTGKEEIAKHVYRQSRRKDKPFVVLNCAAMSSQLLESALFGHEKGSFTGASNLAKGYFEEAHGGTLFLDEIGELTPEAQRALLRVLESGKITRVGSVKEVEVDVRLIAATWRDLKKMCEEGTFRWDLYHRLSVLTIELPPLRERREDIPQLVGRFLQRANKNNERAIKGIEDDALRALMAYDWPGNIRELRNWIVRAVVVAQAEKIRLADLPAHIEDSSHVPARTGSKVTALPVSSLEKDLETLEKEAIEEALRQTDGDTQEATQLLRLELRTLQRRMKKYGIKPKPRGKK